MLSSMVQTKPAGKKDELYRMITIEVKGHDNEVLNSYQQFTAMAAQELDVNVVRIFEPPMVIARMSLMKSVFVHKKHFHQYEMRTRYRVFHIKNITGSTANTFLEYIQRNLPEGVAMKVTKQQIEKFPEHIKPPSSTALSAGVANLGAEKAANYTESVTSAKEEIAAESNDTLIEKIAESTKRNDSVTEEIKDATTLSKSKRPKKPK